MPNQNGDSPSVYTPSIDHIQSPCVAGWRDRFTLKQPDVSGRIFDPTPRFVALRLAGRPDPHGVTEIIIRPLLTRRALNG